MKISEQWLREWVNPALSSSELAEQLTMAGLEVDAVEPVASSFAGVVVGEVNAIAPHPNADQLQVCQVHVGDMQPLTIVCGAANVRVGMRAPLAMVGAQLPNGTTIKPAKLRGVESQGMLCSAAELGLAEQAAGLLELPLDTRIGEDVYEYLKLDDVSLELGLTPNRGDCLSVAGIAREVAVLTRSSLQMPATCAAASVLADRVAVTVHAPADCPRYVGRVIRGINAHAKTPLWMQERLRRSGLRSISAVVDITNYVLLEWGQPMHAFDLAKLSGGIEVRLAQPGEGITLLDGRRVTLDATTLVIADQRQAQAMAGIMGGLDAAIGADSVDLFLESAFFTPQRIAGRARRYGLHTDSSLRFERGVDPALPSLAMERATALLLEIVGGQAGPLSEVVAESHLPKRPTLRLRAAKLQAVLGVTIPADEVVDILTRLAMPPQVINGPSGIEWQLSPPSRRFDISIEADLIEEIARIYGYNRLPMTRPHTALHIAPCPEAVVPANRLRQLLVDRGYQEVVTYSFVEPSLQRLLDPERAPLALANPLSSEMAVMRTSLWCGLLQTLIYNRKRQQTRLKIFELGLNFIKQTDELFQETYLAGLLTGEHLPHQWGSPPRRLDFYDVKADVEALIAPTGVTASFQAQTHPALHPGQSAQISLNGQVAGWLGALHPAILRELDLDEGVYLYELRLDCLARSRVPQFHEISRFPAIQRDIALVVDATLPAQMLCRHVAEAAAEYLQDLRLFDIYQGKGVDLGKKSIALGLTLQAPSRTLTDEEVDALMARVVKKLNNELGATLRK